MHSSVWRSIINVRRFQSTKYLASKERNKNFKCHHRRSPAPHANGPQISKDAAPTKVACASSTEPTIGVTDPSAQSLKERGRDPPSHEVINIHFIKQNTTIPVPSTVQEWTEGEKYFQIVERVPGVPLEETWPSIPQPDRERLARQTAEYLGQLRSFHSAKMESLHGQPLWCPHLFNDDNLGVTHGPLSTAEELWDVLAKSLSDKVPEVVKLRLRDRMPYPHPWTFTHGDLTNCNIIVDPVKFELSGLIDWEGSGYYPVWWEFMGASFGFGEDDLERKRLLLGNMTNQKEARTWFLQFRSLGSRAGDAETETRLKVLKECGIDEDREI